MRSATSKPSFSRDLFVFLRELRENNDREWFAANKERFQWTVQEPALEFIADFAPLLEEISPRFVADPRPVGGSLFRIHRDVRFARDKRPYKTHVGIQFRHESAEDVHAPGFYLHLEPGHVMAVAGIWRPDSTALGRIREAIASDPDRWRAVVGAEGFRRRFRLDGEQLKRPPAGYPVDHPFIEDLKRKDFIAVVGLTERAVTSVGFLGEFASICRAALPFTSFLCDAVEVPA